MSTVLPSAPSLLVNLVDHRAAETSVSVVKHGVLPGRYGTLGFVELDKYSVVALERNLYRLFGLTITEFCGKTTRFFVPFADNIESASAHCRTE